MQAEATAQTEETKVPLTKKEAREAEAFRIAIMSKEIASAYWRKKNPVKK